MKYLISIIIAMVFSSCKKDKLTIDCPVGESNQFTQESTRTNKNNYKVYIYEDQGEGFIKTTTNFINSDNFILSNNIGYPFYFIVEIVSFNNIDNNIDNEIKFTFRGSNVISFINNNDKPSIIYKSDVLNK